MHLLKTRRRTASFLILVASLLFSGFWLWRSPAEEEERGGKPTFASLALTEKQCARAFPGLDREVENAVKRGGIELKREFGDIPGLIQGRVKDGKVGLGEGGDSRSFFGAQETDSETRLKSCIYYLLRKIMFCM
jgi:hypothetical protein